MKKTLILCAFGLMVIAGIFGIKSVFAQTTQPPYVEGGEADTIIGTIGTTTFKTYARKRANISFDLWVATRGSTDSLLITLQTTNDIRDTSSWQNMTNFGGAKTAIGHTARTFQPTKDSTQFMGHFIRALMRHSADTTVATDTSTFRLQITEWGDKLE